ncbi:GntR family transcriptional regulator [Paraferrimonas sp. SM1919]|uniref:GntR family transcriptional regulator n=1 Tax=Paraferrimonas sp. SM1919 TaxID=2662263 RepID=UPI001F0920DF|nr:GntR family transcriptional regulator [Paraferrimonas sp. SM1919]
MAELCFVSLRDAIVEGKVKQGSKLSETKIAEQYQVSRAVVRDAIAKLEVCRLVERKPNIGAKVISLNEASLNELYQVRSALEALAARLAANNMTKQQRQQLISLLDSQKSVVRSNNYYQEAGDVDFHYHIITGSNNQSLVDLLLGSIYYLVRMYRVQLGMTGPRVSNAYFEHQQIAMAIERQDGELAEMLMRRHIQYSMQTIIDKFAANSISQLQL